MKKNIIIVLVAIVSVFTLRGYLESNRTDILNKSASGEIVQASKYDLRGANLSGLKAPGGNFFGARFQRYASGSNGKTLGYPTDLSNADLTGADFSSSDASYVFFENAILKNMKAVNTNFTGSYFKGADLTGMQLVDLDLIDTVNDDSSDASNDDSTDSSSGSSTSDYQLTVFCNAVMPDGTICSGTSWTDPEGNIFKCNCPTSSSSSTSS